MAAVLAAAATAAGATADGGGPTLGSVGGALDGADGKTRYFALGDGRRTVVLAVPRSAGRAAAYRWLRGWYGFPIVANDGTIEGLTRDGRVLTLAQPVGTLQAKTTFLRLDARTLRLRQVVTLRGTYAYDALSPDGTTMYLIQYLSAGDPPRYLVRAYDLEARRLLRQIVSDRREPSRAMTGSPVTRVASRDGTWAYTLYVRPRLPFVHALDTRHGNAVCIDLPWDGSAEALASMRLRLASEGKTLLVVHPNGSAVIAVNLTTFRARRV